MILLTLALFMCQVNSQCPIENCIMCSSNSTDCLQCVPDYTYEKQFGKCLKNQKCHLGYFFNEDTNTCDKCDSTCKSCQTTGKNACLSCGDGYYMELASDGYYFCKTCLFQHCSQCNQFGECISCPQSFGLLDGHCMKCKVTDCALCDKQIMTCQRCFDGFFYDQQSNMCMPNSFCLVGQYLFINDQSRECRPCSNECNHCFGPSAIECHSCKVGFYFEGLYCKICDSQCKNCQYDADFCIECNEGKLLRGNKCVESCDLGEYFDQNENKCKNCNSTCSSCQFTNNYCTNCADLVAYYKTSLLGNCVPRCQSGLYLNLTNEEYNGWILGQFQNLDLQDNICVGCSNNCLTCLGKSTNCLSCTPDQFLYINNGQGQCLNQCPSDTYQDSDPQSQKQYCIKCHFPCKQCVNQDTCAQCEQNFDLINGKCHFKNINQQQCENMGNLYKFNDYCLQYCPATTEANSGVCECHYSCRKCRYQATTNSAICQECAQNYQYISEGICLSVCPSNYFQFNNETSKYCYQQCPANMISFIKINNATFDLSKICIQDQSDIRLQNAISLGYNLYMESACKQNQYVNWKSGSFNPEINCKSCHSSCSSCLGPLESDCLQCSNGLNLWIIHQDNITTTQCKIGCPTGYKQNQPGQCQICQVNCDACATGFILNNNNCVENCPYGTIQMQIQGIDKCVKQEKLILIVEGPNLNNIYSYQNDLTLRVKLMADIFSRQIVSKECQLSKTNERYKVPLQNNTDHLNQFYAIIQSKFLLPNTQFNINCDVMLSDLTELKNTFNFSTFPTPQGSYSLNILEGFCLQSNFTATISGWKIPLYGFQQYPFIYSLSIYINTSLSKLEKFIIFSEQKPAQENFTIDFNLPLTSFRTMVNIELTVDNIFGGTNSSYELDIQCYKNDQTIVKMINQFITDTHFDLLETYTNYTKQQQFIIIAASLLLVKDTQPGTLQERNQRAIEKMLGNQLQQPLSCNPLFDCSSNGQCKANAQNYYQKCQCFANFVGYMCNYNSQELTQVYIFVNSALYFINQSLYIIEDSQTPPTFGFKEILIILKSITRLPEIYEINYINSTIFVLNKIVNSQKLIFSQQIISDILETISNLLDILRIKENSISLENLGQTMVSNVRQIVKKALRIVSLNYYNWVFQRYSLDLENIDVMIASLESLDIDCGNYCGNQIKLMFNGQNPFTISLPSSIIPLSEIQKYYIEAILWPLDMYEIISKQNSFSINVDFLISNIIEISIVEKATGMAKQISKGNQISLLLPRIMNDRDLAEYKINVSDIKCLYRDNNTWSNQDLIVEEVGPNYISCSSNHLSEFSIGINQFIPKVVDRQEKEKKYWSKGHFGAGIGNLAIFFIVYLILIYFGQQKDETIKIERFKSFQNEIQQVNVNAQGANNRGYDLIKSNIKLNKEYKTDQIELIQAKEMINENKQMQDSPLKIPSENEIQGLGQEQGKGQSQEYQQILVNESPSGQASKTSSNQQQSDLQEYGYQKNGTEIMTIWSIYGYFRPLLSTPIWMRIQTIFFYITLHQAIYSICMTDSEENKAQKNVESFILSIVFYWIFSYIFALIIKLLFGSLSKVNESYNYCQKFFILLILFTINLIVTAVRYAKTYNNHPELFFLIFVFIVFDMVILDLICLGISINGKCAFYYNILLIKWSPNNKNWKIY